MFLSVSKSYWSDLSVWNPLDLAVVLPLIDLSQHRAGNGCMMETHQCPPFKGTDRSVAECTELRAGQPQGLIQQEPKSKADTGRRTVLVCWHSAQEAIRGVMCVGDKAPISFLMHFVNVNLCMYLG